MNRELPRAPTTLQPPLKAPPTLSAPTPRPASPSKLLHHARSSSTKASLDSTSSAATTSFIRRTLCAHHLPSSLTSSASVPERPSDLPALPLPLPPLTSSNDIDLQLYAFVVIIIRAYVAPWYGRLTTDHGFVDEVIRLVAHCTRGVEQRVRGVEWEGVVGDEIAGVLGAHLEALRTAQQAARNAPYGGSSADIRRIYATLRPHPGFAPVPDEADPGSVLEQAENEAAYRRLLVQGMLGALLPNEDFEDGCLRTLMREIVAEMVLGNGLAKVCEPWMLWEGIAKAAENVQRGLGVAPPSEEKQEREGKKSRLELYGLLSSEEEAVEVLPVRRQGSSDGQAFSQIFWAAVQLLFLAGAAVRTIVLALATASSLPPTSAEKTPILDMAMWDFLADVTEIRIRLPWLAGLLSLLRWAALTGPGRVGGTKGPLDRLLSHHLLTPLLTPAHLPALLLTLRTTLFPNNAPGPRRPVPNEAEIATLRKKAAVAILRAVPEGVKNVYFAAAVEDGVSGGEADGLEERKERREGRWVREVEDRWLEGMMGDAWLNRRVLCEVLEVVVAAVVPEMREAGGVDGEGKGEE